MISKKIALVNPPSTLDEEFGMLKPGGAPRPPLNLLNLGAVLLSNNYNVSIIDGIAEKKTCKQITEEIISNKYYIVGFTAMTANIDVCADIADRIKSSNSKVITIVGGIHVSVQKERVIDEFPCFDFAVYGEGEKTIIELIKEIFSNQSFGDVDGLIFKNNKEICITSPRKLIKNIDNLPYPAWKLIPNYSSIYTPVASRKSGNLSAYLITSRGCPFHCTFCSHAVMGYTQRNHSLKYIFSMIDEHMNQHSINDFTIYDENFLFNKKRVESFCNHLIENKYNITWSCSSRVDCVDRNLLDLMHKSGCRTIFFGIESGNPLILKRYKKGFIHSQAIKAVSASSDAGIKVSGSFIIGGPQESIKTIVDTIRFALKLKLDYFIPFFYTPLPGSADYKKINKFGTADLSYKAARMSHPSFIPFGLSKRRILLMYKISLVAFYIRPKYFLRILKTMGIRKFLNAAYLFVAHSFK